MSSTQFLLITILLLALAGPTASIPLEMPEVVSMVQLIATPEKFGGKQILVVGFLRLEFEGDCLYLHKEDYQHGISKNAVWVVRNAVIKAQSNTLNMHYVILGGTFDASRKGHMGLHARSLTNIKSAGVWVPP